MSIPVYSLMWGSSLVYRHFRRRKSLPYLRMRIAPLLALLSLAFVILSIRAWAGDMTRAGELSFASASICATTWLVALLSLVSLAFAIGSYRRGVRTSARVYATAVALALAGLTGYLAYWGLVGLRLWAY